MTVPGNQHAEDLRRAFETSFDGDIYDLTRCTICPDEYADSATNDVWLGYQAGHAQLDHLREAAKEAAEHLRNEAAELKKAHTVAGEWDGTEPDAMAECERLIALADRLQANAQSKPPAESGSA